MTAARCSSIGTATGHQLEIDHLGVTVPDLDEALEFFTEVLGGRVIIRLGPFAPPAASHESAPPPDRFGRHPDTRPVGIAMVGLGSSVIEIFEFAAPDQRHDVPRWSDFGSFHLALRVDDVTTAATRLQAAGVELLGEVGAGPEPGMQVLFTRTSWGLILELLSYAPDSALAAAMRPH